MGRDTSMISKLKYCALALAIACLPMKAFATGSLECVIEDKNLDFDFHALFTYTGKSPLFQTGGNAALKVPETYNTLKKFEIDASDLKQQWFEGKDLRLQFYRETSGDALPFAAVELTIVTASPGGDDETVYDGLYRLEVTPAVKAGAESVPVKLEGKVSCSAG